MSAVARITRKRVLAASAAAFSCAQYNAAASACRFASAAAAAASRARREKSLSEKDPS